MRAAFEDIVKSQGMMDGEILKKEEMAALIKELDEKDMSDEDKKDFFIAGIIW